MVAALDVQAFDELPDGIADLVELSKAEGHDLVERLVDDWRDGSNRFDRIGEVACRVRLGAELVAVGGLNRDPYIDDPKVGRIRHVYVVPEARGAGVGRALVEALVDHARSRFTRVRLRTMTAAAAGFYRALGFEETPEEAESTHHIRLL